MTDFPPSQAASAKGVAQKVLSIRGMNDLLGPDAKTWQNIEKKIKDVYSRFGFEEIRTPILEMTALFSRGVGTDTDIVEKEMYSFQDRNEAHVSLRPEGTAGVVRSLIEHSWLNDHPVTKLYYIGPMFRHERPQKGRLRQFHQYGIELIGVPHPSADAEVMAAQSVLYKEVDLKNVQLEISSVGCKDCRPVYQKKLQAILEKQIEQVPEDFRPRIKTNPQRIFDHKDPKAQALSQTLPLLIDHLCEGCKEHFALVQKNLKDMLAPIGGDFHINPRIVRGLDYYNRSAFEFTSQNLGAQSAAGGGGRYDQLFQDLGGKPTPAVGYAGGLERLVMLTEGKTWPVNDKRVSLIFATEAAFSYVLKLSTELRLISDLVVDFDLQGRNMKNQMKRADRFGSEMALIFGDDEIQKNAVTLKNMKTQQQQLLPLDEVIRDLKK